MSAAESKESLNWEPGVLEHYKAVLEKMPIFLRPMAEKSITKKSHSNAAEAGRDQISEKDLVDAFFSETPFGFHGPMMADLEDVGLDYKKYGHPIDYNKGFFGKK